MLMPSIFAGKREMNKKKIRLIIALMSVALAGNHIAPGLLDCARYPSQRKTV